MPNPDNPLEDLRQALAATLLALGHAPAYDLAYTADKPAWVGYADRGRRTGILTDPGRCMRSGVSYNPARGRYYLWQQIPNEDRGLGIYSAPNVWGPWTRLFYTESWDTPAGERGEFPVKWMDQAGIGQQGTMYLLFSGGDRLSVRKATVKPGY